MIPLTTEDKCNHFLRLLLAISKVLSRPNSSEERTFPKIFTKTFIKV